MIRYLPFLILLFNFLFTSCDRKPKYENDVQSKTRITSDTTSKANISKKVSFSVFKNGTFTSGKNIGSSHFFFRLNRTFIGKDSLWVIANISHATAKKAGFYLLNNPTTIQYDTTDSGYKINAVIEVQYVPLDNGNNILHTYNKNEIEFSNVYEKLRDNDYLHDRQPKVTFKTDGKRCVNGSYIQLKHNLEITEKENQLYIKLDSLEITSFGGINASDFTFLSSTNFPDSLFFDKHQATFPATYILDGTNSKYDPVRERIRENQKREQNKEELE